MCGVEASADRESTHNKHASRLFVMNCFSPDSLAISEIVTNRGNKHYSQVYIVSKGFDTARDAIYFFAKTAGHGENKGNNKCTKIS